MGAARRKKNRTHVRPEDNPNAAKVPKSFIIRSGKITRPVQQLIRDLRQVMEPNTASRLKERSNNHLKDFIAVAGQLNVTHFMILSKTEKATNLRICRNPRGPTLCFHVNQYTLMKDVLAAQAKPKSPGQEYQHAPLLVLNNFAGQQNHVKLMATMFQNMFPSLNIHELQLNDCRRVVLINYDSETETIDMRHYYIHVKPVGISKSVKRIVQTNLPNMHQFTDISEYVLREAQASESDVEDIGSENVVTLPQNYVGRNNKRSQQRAIKLIEIGPRLQLKLVKIQNGFCDGEVIYHSLIDRTPEDIRKQKEEFDKKQHERDARRREQELNVERKAEEREQHRIRCGAKRTVSFDPETKEDQSSAETAEPPKKKKIPRKA